MDTQTMPAIASAETQSISLTEEDESGSFVFILSVRLPKQSSIIATAVGLIAMIIGVFIVY